MMKTLVAKDLAKIIVALLVSTGGQLALARDSFAQQATTKCIKGRQECPIIIRLRAGGPRILVQGKLSPRLSSFSYQFGGEAGQTLVWHYKGPAVHVVLMDPIGDSEGPGLPEEVELQRNGPFVFGISSNKMAEGIYGKFRITFQLNKSK